MVRGCRPPHQRPGTRDTRMEEDGTATSISDRCTDPRTGTAGNARNMTMRPRRGHRGFGRGVARTGQSPRRSNRLASTCQPPTSEGKANTCPGLSYLRQVSCSDLWTSARIRVKNSRIAAIYLVAFTKLQFRERLKGRFY